MKQKKTFNRKAAKRRGSSDPSNVYDEKGEQIEIPLEGSLGLLASGYKGIMLWRKKRQNHLQKILDKKIQG